jgi:hypothetical protein
LIEALQWPQEPDFCAIRIISVSPEIHNGFENSNIIPLFQMIAKNVGIQRAHGRFIIATNIDILFSNELVKFLASGKLRKNRMYRVDRYDVPGNIPTGMPLDEQMDWCRRNVMRLYRRSETIEIKDGVIPFQKKKSKKLRKRISEWFSHDEPVLHTNACGDFTLLSKKYWQRAFGYPEFPLRAMKLDSLLCYTAHYIGAKEIVLDPPMQVYHLDHSGRSDGAMVALMERDSGGAAYQVPMIQYMAWVDQMRTSRRPMTFNDQNWGLVNINLPETVVIERKG